MTLIGDRPEWVLSMLACFRLGAIALPCSPQLRSADLAHRAAAANPTLAIGEAEYLTELPDGVDAIDMDDFAAILDEERAQVPPAEPADLRPTDPALIVFTSGTTSAEPRGVLHAQRFLTGQSVQARHW